MNIEIYTPCPGVPSYIVRYIREIIALANFQYNNIDSASVTLMEHCYFDAKLYVCKIEFIFQDQSFLIIKKGNSYLMAVYEAKQDLFNKIKINSQFDHN